MDLQEKRQLDLAAQVAKVKTHARPWRSIIALVLAIVAAIASYVAGQNFSIGPGRDSRQARWSLSPRPPRSACSLSLR